MKLYKTIGFLGILTGYFLPAMAANGIGGSVATMGGGASFATGRACNGAAFANRGLAGISSPGVVTVGRGVTGSGVAITIPGYGSGYPAFVAARANFSRNGAAFANRGLAGISSPGVVTVGNGVTGSGVAITIPGYGSGYPALVAARACFSGNDGAFANRQGDFGRRGNSDCNEGGSVVYADNGYYPNYNNANYLGLPPWYRLNYYTPTSEELANGTAYQNIPSSRAWRGYGVPDGYPGTTGYGMPTSQANIPAGYQPPAADVDFVVAVQRELRRRGFYRGIVNGISDAATRAAIRSFETSAGLPVTGVIGIPLLRTLGFF